MEPADRIESDPRHRRWGGLEWSGWYALDKTGNGAGLVPTGRGIYRLQRVGHPELIYVGISDRLRSRISNLRNGVGHSAAPCAAAHLSRGNVIEISWATVSQRGNKDEERRDLLGLEVDLIAACRRLFGQSPACQFHGAPLE
jgi:hypothetical protein